jgi:hypothetical protein
MRDAPTSRTARAHHRQISEALAHLEKVLLEGLRHGFFDCSIACEIGTSGKRHLVIRAGKSHKFTIPEEEVPRLRSTQSGDPRDGDA